MGLYKSNVLIAGQNTLSTAAEVVLAARPERIFLKITNDDAAIKVYVGPDSGVTASNGHVIKPGAEMTMEGYIGPIWMIAASGTPTVTYAEW
jgi:hypothetical protein